MPNEPTGSNPRKPRKYHRPTARETVERDNAIIRLKLQGRTWASLCEELGVAETTARDAYYKWSRRQFLIIEDDPIEWLNEKLAIFEVLFEDLGEIRSKTHKMTVTGEDGEEHEVLVLDASITDQISAIAQQRGLVKDAVKLRQLGGLLPTQLNRIRTELDVRFVANQIVRILNEDGVPIATRERLMQALEAAR